MTGDFSAYIDSDEGYEHVVGRETTDGQNDNMGQIATSLQQQLTKNQCHTAWKTVSQIDHICMSRRWITAQQDKMQPVNMGE